MRICCILSMSHSLSIGSVTTLADLRAAVTGATPKIVKISGIITGGQYHKSPSLDNNGLTYLIDGKVVDVGNQ